MLELRIQTWNFKVEFKIKEIPKFLGIFNPLKEISLSNTCMQSVEPHHLRGKYSYPFVMLARATGKVWLAEFILGILLLCRKRNYADCILIILLEHSTWYSQDLSGGTHGTLCAHVFTRALGCVGVICCSVIKTCLACWRCRRSPRACGIEQSFLQHCKRAMMERETQVQPF